MKVFIVTNKMNFEFKDGSFSTWDVNPINLYGFKTIEEAQEEVETLREEELEMYKTWLHGNDHRCFVHHIYMIEELIIF